MSTSATPAAHKTSQQSGRRLPRRPVVWEGTWQDADGAFHRCEVRDVSARGIFIRPLQAAPKPLAQGTRIRVWFRTPDLRASEFLIEGHVRWSGHSVVHGCVGFGVQFDGVHAELAGWLADNLLGNVSPRDARTIVVADARTPRWELPQLDVDGLVSSSWANDTSNE